MIIIQARDRNHLNEIINRDLQRYGNQCSLNHIDVSQVEDFHNIFAHSDFNGDVSQWNMSNATDVSGMFSDSPFNGDVSGWDVSKVVYMSSMFGISPFNGDISQWNTSNVVDMSDMFALSSFSGDISRWNLEQVVMLDNAFSDFHDSPLGYLCILEGFCYFPTTDPRHAQFEELERLAQSLDLTPLDTAKFIYQSLHPELLEEHGLSDFTLPQ